ncbi:hypothetical protein KM043_005992 [Ampulex compressa]|nr:hypothetical protein KM043_005992 [Ampulex compressa]
MAAKRSATTELNHDNWNEENEPEEAGVFLKASDDVLEKRVLKAARRRLPPRDAAAKSAFGTFTGFKTSTTNPSPFRFLANTKVGATTSLATNTNTTKPVASNGASKNPENGTDKTEDTSEKQASTNISTSKKSTSEQENDKAKKSSDYFAKLKGLNESVAQWIKTNVDSNPFCILTPIFRDYERYLKDIESKHGNDTEKSAPLPEEKPAMQSDENVKDNASTEKSSDNSPFGNASTKPSSDATEWKPQKSIFSNVNADAIFGGISPFNNAFSNTSTQTSMFNVRRKKTMRDVLGREIPDENPFVTKLPNTTDNKSESEKAKSVIKTSSGSFPSTNTNSAIFSFGQSSATTNASAGFSFGSVKPFSFGVQAVKSRDTDGQTESETKEEEDEEPPKPEFKPITEEGAIYEQRCKVFVKKGENFSDRGVGILFLKPTPNGKTQLIVRAETSLGLLLLNTLLTESIPIKRMSKNTIMIVCLPKPDSSPPPVPVLLRVKTDDDANVLFETLNKHKKYTVL